MKVMNEKYQQALDIIKHAHTVSSEVKDIEELYPNEIDTLQELVDMMKPLKFIDLQIDNLSYERDLNRGKRMIVYDRKLKQLVCLSHKNSAGYVWVNPTTHVHWFKTSIGVEFEENRFYRNIWEEE